MVYETRKEYQNNRHRDGKSESFPRNGAPPRPYFKSTSDERRTTHNRGNGKDDVLMVENQYQQQLPKMPSELSTVAQNSSESPTFQKSPHPTDLKLNAFRARDYDRPFEKQRDASDIQYFDSSYGSMLSSAADVTGFYSQQDQIRDFSRMAMESISSQLEVNESEAPLSLLVSPLLEGISPRLNFPKEATIPERDGETMSRSQNRSLETESGRRTIDGTNMLMNGVKYDDDGNAYFEERTSTIGSFIRHFFYNPISPEFTALQQFNWAVFLGIASGLVTAVWKMLIEFGIDLLWKRIPEHLYHLGVFTDDSGMFPIYHYLWILPSLISAILSYIFAFLPNIPTQDDWITSIHSKGVQDHSTFFHLCILSTFTMWSGLSLGPELPLVLTGGMFGSWLGIITKQSMLQARVLNLTGAAAAISGFFGFPMAGALFVLELPHRAGLQYFEALSPATIASIVAVLSNRLVTGNDVTGYFRYPFLTASLPSSIFSSAIVFGFYGCLVGVVYLIAVKHVKNSVHNWFSHSNQSGHHRVHEHDEEAKERNPLLEKSNLNQTDSKPKYAPRCIEISNKPRRAAASGAIVGVLVGVIGIFLPHTFFWGEAQLQNLIDKGRTPLPVFGSSVESPISGLTKHAFCMIDPNDADAIKAGFGMGCASMIVIMKIIAIGLSLGTGITGGQFWGPLYVGCAAAHWLQDVCVWIGSRFGFGVFLTAHPCVMILCTMGSAHVVTYRTHLGIMLILTVTISSFSAKDDPNSAKGFAGDYSAVFPLLVVSVYVAMMISRDVVFYSSQRSRGDIIAVPEVLCQPGMAGEPVVVRYEESESDNSSFDSSTSSSLSDIENFDSDRVTVPPGNFEMLDHENLPTKRRSPSSQASPRNNSRSDQVKHMWVEGLNEKQLSSARLDELLNFIVDEKKEEKLEEVVFDSKNHRRCQSLPVTHQPNEKPASLHNFDRHKRSSPVSTTKHVRSNTKGSLHRVSSFGNLEEHQPELLDQARLRAASSAIDSKHNRIPSSSGGSTKKHIRRISSASPRGFRDNKTKHFVIDDSPSFVEAPAALSLDDIEQSFDQVLNFSPQGLHPKYSL